VYRACARVQENERFKMRMLARYTLLLQTPLLRQAINDKDSLLLIQERCIFASNSE